MQDLIFEVKEVFNAGDGKVTKVLAEYSGDVVVRKSKTELTLYGNLNIEICEESANHILDYQNKKLCGFKKRLIQTYLPKEESVTNGIFGVIVNDAKGIEPEFYILPLDSYNIYSKLSVGDKLVIVDGELDFDIELLRKQIGEVYKELSQVQVNEIVDNVV